LYAPESGKYSLIQFCKYSFGDIMVAPVIAALKVEEALNIL